MIFNVNKVSDNECAWVTIVYAKSNYNELMDTNFFGNYFTWCNRRGRKSYMFTQADTIDDSGMGILKYLERKITVLDNHSPEMNPSEEEIKNIIYSMDLNSPAGPVVTVSISFNAPEQH
ncbi:hypothetical protein HAX54_034814 [Datura stramonium]|uniref:Uncharacterized protein n=1 Tax=Datura stramonium TaxID=4076 RepID=A0ABS8VEH7_DATST|nr:hypothetical protein [Datura stramonium]